MKHVNPHLRIRTDNPAGRRRNEREIRRSLGWQSWKFSGIPSRSFPGTTDEISGYRLWYFRRFCSFSRSTSRYVFFLFSHLLFLWWMEAAGEGKNTWKYIFQAMIRVFREKRTKSKKCRYICWNIEGNAKSWLWKPENFFCPLELDIYFLEFAAFRTTDFFREISSINRFVNSL